MNTPTSRLLPRFARPTLNLPESKGPVLVMGAAPNFRLPRGFDASWALATVNASQLLAETFGLAVPDIAVIRRGIMVGKSEQDFYKRDLLRGRKAKHLIVPVWPGADDRLRAGCRTFDYGFDTLQALTKWQLAGVVFQFTGTFPFWRGWHRKISTGAFTILLSRLAGFAPVVVSGFSLSQGGHGYDARNAFRYHADEDTILLRKLAARGEPVYAEDPAFALESGLPLWEGRVP